MGGRGEAREREGGCGGSKWKHEEHNIEAAV